MRVPQGGKIFILYYIMRMIYQIHLRISNDIFRCPFPCHANGVNLRRNFTFRAQREYHFDEIKISRFAAGEIYHCNVGRAIYAQNIKKKTESPSGRLVQSSEHEI